MSYFDGPNKGYGWNAGIFLVDDETCIRKTMTIAANHAQVVTRDNGRKVVPAGAVIPSNDGNAVGILFEDIDVTEGAKMGSVITKGVILEDKLPAAIESSAEAVLTGITVITASPAILRPAIYAFKELVALTVTSAAGTAQGDTKLTVTGHSLGAGEAYYYRVTDTTAATVALGEVISTSGDKAFTAWNGSADITAATDKKLALVVVNAKNEAIAYGSCTVTAKAAG